MKANISEILCTIQGEGLLVGTKQVFVRFSGCNLRCSYCDTVRSFTNSNVCEIYREVGKNEKLEQLSNPVSVMDVSRIIKSFNCSWVSFTGGEPLLSADFIKQVILDLDCNDYKFLLETNGTLPKQLVDIIDLMDCISMDIKLPSTVDADFYKEHEEFLSIAQQKQCYIKVVIPRKYNKGEFTKALQLVKKVNPNITFFIQPYTPRKNERPVDIFECIALQEYALNFINDVRILPQIHPWLGVT